MLPDEMWEEILMYVDVIDLLTLRTVTKQFLRVIDQVIKRKSKWYEKCLKEVPKKYWTSILEHHTNPELSGCDFNKSKSHSPIWIAMYKSWIRWNDLSDKMTRQMSIDVAESRQFIAGFSVSGNIIAIAVGNHDIQGGHVAVYDITQLNKGPIHVGHGSRGTTVRDVQLWRKGNHPLLDRPERKVYPPKSNSLISANLGYFYTLDTTHRSPNDWHTLTIEQPSDLDSRIIRWIKPSSQSIYAIDADGDKVLLLSLHHVHRHLTIDEISAKSGESRNISTIHPHVGLSSNIFKPCVVVCLNDDGSDIDLSVAGRQFKNYNSQLDLKLNSYIRSCCYHIGLLIFGLGSGELYIIHVKDADQLEHLNLETMRYKILALNDGPIYHIAVTEYNSVHYIVATTSKKLHLVEFY